MWELDCEESWAPKNWCFWTVVLEKTLESLPWTARKSNQSMVKEISPKIHWKDWCWSWNSNTLAPSCEELTHWKRLWCWEGLGAGGEGGDRGWDGWMASPTWWVWVWVNSGSLCWTGRPGMLRFVGLQRVGHDWATELNWIDWICFLHLCLCFRFEYEFICTIFLDSTYKWYCMTIVLSFWLTWFCMTGSRPSQDEIMIWIQRSAQTLIRWKHGRGLWSSLWAVFTRVDDQDWRTDHDLDVRLSCGPGSTSGALWVSRDWGEFWSQNVTALNVQAFCPF